MKRHGGATTGAIAKLLVRPALTHFDEAQSAENGDDLDGLQYGNLAHHLDNGDILDADKLGFEVRLAIFKKHRDNFPKV